MSDVQQVLIEVGVVAIVSLPIWAFIVRKRLAEGAFLPYNRRWPVPWGPVGALMAGAFLVLSLLQLGVGGGPADQPRELPEITPDQLVELALGGAAVNLAMVAFAVVFFLRAGMSTRGDLGIPEDLATLLADFRLGALTAVAALLPVYGLQSILVVGLDIPSEHSTLELLREHATPLVLVSAWISAGLAAPIFEEFIFRLLFQGWMERVEDEALGIAGMMTLQGDAEGEAVEHDDPHLQGAPPALLRMRRRRGEPPIPPDETFAGLPHGWGPIIISSFVFALLHLSQGAAVAPLFLLAMMFGYLYQRTHRITPSIFAHMVFNTISLVAAYAAPAAG